jgi:DNA repair exonuclease SbcCD ATPase subunit
MTVARTTQDLAEARKQLEALVEDQKRIRANIKELPSSSRAYKRLVEKIDEQEPQIEKVQNDIKTLLAQQNSQQKAFDDFLAAFTAE